MDPSSECEECGYDLSAVPAERCPECGVFVGRYRRFVRRPWPPWRRMMWRMCAPALGVCAIVFGLAMVEFGRDILAFGWVLAIGVWLVLAVAAPLQAASSMVAECDLRPRRRAAHLQLACAGFSANVLIAFCTLWVIGRLLF